MVGFIEFINGEKMLNFEHHANALSVKDFDFNAIRFYIDRFIADGAITMIYSPANHGKTWLHYAIVKQIVQNPSKEVFYFDRDNGLRTLKQRGIERHLSSHLNWKYYTSSNLNMDTDELLSSLDKDAHGMRLANKVFVFDSTRDFIYDIGSDRQVKNFMEVMKRMRDNGATVLLVHHTTKNGKVFDGSADFEKSADNIFFLTQKSRIENLISYHLEVKKQRDPTEDLGFTVNTHTLELKKIDELHASLDEKQEEFIKKACEIIESKNGVLQKEVLEFCGLKADDKTGRGYLKKFSGEFWKWEKRGVNKFYLPLNNTQNIGHIVDSGTNGNSGEA